MPHDVSTQRLCDVPKAIHKVQSSHLRGVGVGGVSQPSPYGPAYERPERAARVCASAGSAMVLTRSRGRCLGRWLTVEGLNGGRLLLTFVAGARVSANTCRRVII